jgi:hypothetical protein
MSCGGWQHSVETQARRLCADEIVESMSGQKTEER